MKKLIISTIIAALSFTKAFAQEASFEDKISALANDFDQANYQIADKKAKIDAFEAAANSAEFLAIENPTRPEPLIWEAIIIASEAGTRHDLKSLSMLKNAKSLCESAIALNPNAMGGSAYTTLGSLYAQVPPFPISFGNGKKAKEDFETALKIDDKNTDTLYFYAQYLLKLHDKVNAKKYADLALNSLPRQNRPIGDAGLHADLVRLQSQIAN